jgi:hypothetical protein
MAGALTRDNAIFAMTGATDLSDKEGYAVKIVGSTVALATADTGIFGVVLDGEATTGKSTIASMAGASGTVKVKLGDTVALGGNLKVHTDGKFRAHTTTLNVSAVAMEAGVVDDLIEAALTTGFTNV